MVKNGNNKSQRRKKIPSIISDKAFARIDKIDSDIIELLLKGKGNKSISLIIKMPLSTVQRRTRKLFELGLLNNKVELNYEKLGYKRGFLHVYLSDGLIEKIGQTLTQKPGILSVAVHIGNSDIVALFIYKDSKQLLDTISEVKQIEGVKNVLWSEEVYFFPLGEGKFNILNL